jgi:hypothetical protein
MKGISDGGFLPKAATPRTDARSRKSDDGKLASYEVAGLDETNSSRPEGTMEDCPPPPSFQDGILSGLHPATMWLANFQLSLWDEAGWPRRSETKAGRAGRRETISPFRRLTVIFSCFVRR